MANVSLLVSVNTCSPSRLRWFLAGLADPQDSATLTPIAPGLLPSSGGCFCSVKPLGISPIPHIFGSPAGNDKG